MTPTSSFIMYTFVTLQPPPLRDISFSINKRTIKFRDAKFSNLIGQKDLKVLKDPAERL